MSTESNQITSNDIAGWVESGAAFMADHLTSGPQALVTIAVIVMVCVGLRVLISIARVAVTGLLAIAVLVVGIGWLAANDVTPAGVASSIQHAGQVVENTLDQPARVE